MAKQPKIRFKGFTEEWKEKKISDLLLERIDMAPQNDAYPLMAFVANKGIVSKGDRYDRSALIKDAVNKPYKRTSYGDFIYSSNNLEAGSIGMNFYGNASISPVYSIFAPKGDNNPYYLGVRLAMPDVIHEMVRCRQGVVYGQWKIHEDEFLNISVKMPKPDEQKAISQVIIDLTTTISQREAELEKLMNIKRALLEKLFPQDRQFIPAIRFRGFEEKWEPKILGNEIEETGTKNRNNLPLESYSITNEAGFIPQNEKFENGGYVADADKTMYTIVPPQSFAYNPARINVGSIGYYNGTKDVIVSSLYIVFKTSEAIHDDFLMAWFKSDIFNHLIYTLQEGGVRQYFFYDKMVQCPILLPKTPEQEKIAKLVNSLYKTISLRERQITLLKHTKQALLEQMFVNE